MVNTSSERSPSSAAAARIRQAAIEAFAEAGYAGTSTRAITGHLGMSATAMYPHYRSKEELLFAIASEGHRLVLDAMRAAEAQARALSGATWTSRLRGVVAAFAQWQARESRLARVVQYEMRSLSREHFHEIAAIREETTALVADLVDGGIVAGEFGVKDGGDAVLAIMSLCVDVCRWFPARGYRNPEVVGAVYANLAASLVESRLR
ncbi:TetR/AcrR family transcriptional regulator [Gordonia sp. CPCC 205333]|uniref:TetR/AcrR family transcriptional regulator n=1 Tax=Gordonia sp. CPCC 205333 TaxID=3140790 RepID=UPI003AF3FD66